MLKCLKLKHNIRGTELRNKGSGLVVSVLLIINLLCDFQKSHSSFLTLVPSSEKKNGYILNAIRIISLFSFKMRVFLCIIVIFKQNVHLNHSMKLKIYSQFPYFAIVFFISSELQIFLMKKDNLSLVSYLILSRRFFYGNIKA